MASVVNTPSMGMQVVSPESSLRRATAVPARLVGVIGTPDVVERWVGPQLLQATDARGVADVIEAIAEDPHFWALIDERKAALPEPLNTAQTLVLGVRLQEVFGGESGFARGLRDLAPLAAFQIKTPPKAVSDEEPLWFAYDPAIPPEIADAIVQGIYASIALNGIVHVARCTNSTPAPWWRRALVARWVAAQYAYLRFVAALPGSDVPASVVAPAERLDLAALAAKNAACQAALAALVTQAQQAGVTIYTPFPEQDHDPR